MKIISIILTLFLVFIPTREDVVGSWKLYNVCLDTNIYERLWDPSLKRILDCDDSKRLMSLDHIIEFKKDNTYKVTVLDDSVAFGVYEVRRDYIDKLFLSNFVDNVEDFKVAEYTYWFKSQDGMDFLVLHNHKNPKADSKLYYYVKK